MMWFEELFGFAESFPKEVRDKFEWEGNTLTSKVNGKQFTCGTLEIPTLEALRKEIDLGNGGGKKLSLTEVVANVQSLHLAPENAQAMFQAASQFNLLEMIDPEVTPEEGVGIYQHDGTQGPACAIACGAGTVYRNYLVPMGDHIGQNTLSQVDCLDEIGKALGNENESLWEMRNGYALASLNGLMDIQKQIESLDEAGYEALKGKLKIGIQWNTEVTLNGNGQLVSQAYCSALPVGYSQVMSSFWAPFAELVLEASYEATFYAALKNYQQTGQPKLYLTLVGGGVFGNAPEWIFSAIEKAAHKFAHTPLEVIMVSYGKSNEQFREFMHSLS
ncbi:MAG: hypothetical protein AAFR61_23845 [Bacteroidota bacterium]